MQSTVVVVVMVVLGALMTFVDSHPVNSSLKNVCPNIVKRAEWKARNPIVEVPLDFSPTPYVVVHHGGLKQYCHSEDACSEIVRSYQNLHIDTNGWFDIGYQFVIGEDGNVYEGRGWNNGGAHAPGYNTQSIGICIIGDYSNFLPNDAALKALNSLIKCGVSLGKIRVNYKVIGHRQAKVTLCPGNTFYEYVKKMPHWTSDPVPIHSTNDTHLKA